MKAATLAASALLACAVTAHAQSRCLNSRAVTDSARDDAITVLQSGSPLVAELRQEQGMTAPTALESVRTVRDIATCARLAAAFGRPIAAHERYAVLRIGNLFYVRDPDQHLGTGVFVDTTYHVVMRLGPATESSVHKP